MQLGAELHLEDLLVAMRWQQRRRRGPVNRSVTNSHYKNMHDNMGNSTVDSGSNDQGVMFETTFVIAGGLYK